MKNWEKQFKEKWHKYLNPEINTYKLPNEKMVVNWFIKEMQNLLDNKDKEWQKRYKEAKILTAEESYEAGKREIIKVIDKAFIENGGKIDLVDWERYFRRFK